MLRTLVATLAPGAELPPELATLGRGWLSDLHALHTYQLKKLEEATADRE